MSFKPPPPLTISDDVSTDWTLFKNQFLLFLTATEAENKSNQVKIAQLLNVIGSEALSIFYTFKLGQLEDLTFEEVLEAFDKHFTPKKNVVYQRYLFFKRTQAQGEPFNSFLTDLRKLAIHCDFGDQESHLIRDKIVIGINDEGVQEKLLQQVNVKLDDAIKYCRLVESSREQVTTITKDKGLAPSVDHNIVNTRPNQLRVKSEDVVHTVNKPSQQNAHQRHSNKFKYTVKKQADDRSNNRPRLKPNPDHNTSKPYLCKKCNTKHLPAQCPAFGQSCYLCNKLNHFSVGCFKNKNRPTGKQVNDLGLVGLSEDQEFTIDNVSSANDKNAWYENVDIYGHSVKFKLDSGAEINILPKQTLLQIDKNLLEFVVNSNIKLESYGGFKLNTEGVIALECKLNCDVTKEDFVIVNHPKCIPILGLNTCVRLGLLKRVNAVSAESKEEVVEKNLEVFSGLGCFPKTQTLKVDKDAVPIVRPPRRVPYAVLPKLKSTLLNLERLGVIKKVEQPRNWVSNLVIVEKSDKSLRICLDPQPLNAALLNEPFLIPTLEEIKSKLANKKIFSVLDLKDGFYHVKLDDESSHLCTFSSPFGCYRFLRLPFGVKVAPEIFQKQNTEIFSDIEGVTVYFDDLLIAADSIEQHDSILREVFKRAKQHCVKFNPRKFQYKLSKVNFLGHTFTSEGVELDKNHVNSVVDLPNPSNKKELQSMLGLFNYFREFIPNMSTIVSPLRELLKKSSKWMWLPTHSESVNKLKKAVTSAPVLATFDPKKLIEVHSDASKDGIGCCLLQEGRPISFASRSLSYSEQQYAQCEKEFLSICFAISKYHHLLYGHKFVVYNDCKPLESIMQKPINKIQSPRLQRLKLKLVKYDFVIKYMPGNKMVIADLLSRTCKEVASLDNNCDECVNIDNVDRVVPHYLPISDRKRIEFVKCTQNDPALSLVKSYYKNGWPTNKKDIPDCVKVYHNKRNDLYVHNDLVFLNDKIVVPVSLRKAMLDLLHENHLGCEKTKSRARQLIYWPGMSVDIDNMILNCKLCQKYANANVKEYLMSHDIPDLPFNKVGVDIAEYGGKIFLLLVDYYSKWIECIEIKSKTATDVVRELKKLFAVHGIPAKVIGDNNPFGSYEFRKFAMNWNFEIVTSSPLYPKSNGQIERTVQTFKKILKKCCEDNKDINIALLELRNTPVVAGLSPAQLLMSRRLRSKLPVSANLLMPQTYDREVVNQDLSNKQECSAENYNKNARSRCNTFKVLDDVNVYNVRTRSWEPGQIVGLAPEPRSYIVKLFRTGRVVRRNTFHLKLRPVSLRVKSDVSKAKPLHAPQHVYSSPDVQKLMSQSPKRVDSPPGSPSVRSAVPNAQQSSPVSSPSSGQSATNASQSSPVSGDNLGYRTRFGRKIRKPLWFQDYVD